jgi:hypothetical protein
MDNHKHYRAWIIAIFGALALAQIASAQTVDATGAFDRFMTQVTGAGKQTVGFSSTGTPMSVPGVPGASTDGAAGVKATATGSFTNPSGNRVAVAATGRIPNSQIAAAVGRFAGRIAGPLAIGTALFDLAKELDFDLTKDADGNTQFAQSTPLPSVFYSMRSGGVSHNSTSAVGACQLDYNPASFTVTGWVQISATNGYCSVIRLSDGAFYAQDLPVYVITCPSTTTSTAVATACLIPANGTPGVPGSTPSTLTAFTDAIASKSGWPTTSAISRLAVEAATATQTKYRPTAVTVTGPATSTGTTTTTNNPTNNTTKTETVTHNHNYSGDTITTTNTTNITTINNITGATTIEEKTETKLPEPEPKDPCIDHPDRIGCMEVDTPEADIPTQTKNISYTPETLFSSGGSCPADVVYENIVLSYGPTCDALSNYIKPMIIAISLFMAYLIILGVRE